MKGWLRWAVASLTVLVFAAQSVISREAFLYVQRERSYAAGSMGRICHSRAGCRCGRSGFSGQEFCPRSKEAWGS